MATINRKATVPDHFGARPELLGLYITNEVVRVSGQNVETLRDFTDALRKNGMPEVKMTGRNGKDDHVLSITQEGTSLNGKKAANLDELKNMIRLVDMVVIDSDFRPASRH